MAEKQLSLLFVDDDEIAHTLIGDFLKGRELHHAYSAEEALNIIDDNNIHIVITDIIMDEMDGIALTRKIKQIRNTIQVIIITGDNETDNLINALDAGANDFLVKPLKKEDLMVALKSTEEKIMRWRNALRNLFVKKRS